MRFEPPPLLVIERRYHEIRIPVKFGASPCADISLDISSRLKIYRQYYRRRRLALHWRGTSSLPEDKSMREGQCGPKFGWAFGMRPENFGFDAGSFWAGRGRSRGGPFSGGRMFDQGHLKYVILRLL